MTTPSIAGNGYSKQFRPPGLKNMTELLSLWCIGENGFRDCFLPPEGGVFSSSMARRGWAFVNSHSDECRIWVF